MYSRLTIALVLSQDAGFAVRNSTNSDRYALGTMGDPATRGAELEQLTLEAAKVSEIYF